MFNSVNSVNSVNIVNSVNSVNCVNSYSAVLPPSLMVFFVCGGGEVYSLESNHSAGSCFFAWEGGGGGNLRPSF